MYVGSHREVPSTFTAAVIVSRVPPTSNARFSDVLHNTRHFLAYSQRSELWISILEIAQCGLTPTTEANSVNISREAHSLQATPSLFACVSSLSTCAAQSVPVHPPPNDAAWVPRRWQKEFMHGSKSHWSTHACNEPDEKYHPRASSIPLVRA